MLEMAINNVEMGSELDRVHILTCCDPYLGIYHKHFDDFIFQGTQTLNRKLIAI